MHQSSIVCLVKLTSLPLPRHFFTAPQGETGYSQLRSLRLTSWTRHQLQTASTKSLEPTSLRQTHQRPGFIFQQGAFTSSKVSDWSSASGRVLLSRHHDPCLALSLLSLCISCIWHLLFPSLFLPPSVPSVQWIQYNLFFSPVPCMNALWGRAYGSHATHWSVLSPCSDRETPASFWR